MPTPLPLHEEFLLLALGEKSGTAIASESLEYPLAAAILSELILQQRIRLDQSRKKNPLVDVVDRSSTGDEVVDEGLKKIQSAKRRASLNTWIERIAGIKQLKHRTALGLCDKRILRSEKGKVLWIFDRKIYPELDPKPERQLVSRMRKAIERDHNDIPPRDAIIIALADKTHLLKKKFDKDLLKSRKKRIKQITEGSLTAQAAREVMDAMMAAIFFGAVMPAVYS